jgi:hypothetical protein
MLKNIPAPNKRDAKSEMVNAFIVFIFTDLSEVNRAAKIIFLDHPLHLMQVF